METKMTTKKRIFYNFTYYFERKINMKEELKKVTFSINENFIKIFDENSKIIRIISKQAIFVATPIYEND